MDKPLGKSPLADITFEFKTGKLGDFTYKPTVFKPRSVTFDMPILPWQRDMFEKFMYGGTLTAPVAPPVETPFFAELTLTATQVLDLPVPGVKCRQNRRRSLTTVSGLEPFTNAATYWKHSEWRPNVKFAKAVPELTYIEYDVGADPRWHVTAVAHEVSHILAGKDRDWEVPLHNEYAHGPDFYSAFERTVLALGLDDLDLRHMLVFEHSYSRRKDSQTFIEGWANRLGWQFGEKWNSGPIDSIDLYVDDMTPFKPPKKWWQFK